MAANALIFKDAEKARDAILESQKKEIANLYSKWADDIGDRANYYKNKTTASSAVAERQMKELQKQLKSTSQQISNEVYSKIKQNIYVVSDITVKSNIAWLKELGFKGEGINIAFSNVPDSTVRKLITGQIYDSGWSLSQRIWSDNQQTMKDAYQVVAKGLAENKPIYDIAKDLENYVRPEARLPWNFKSSDGAKIFKKQVDYNAQRLARTLVQHGYQQSFIEVTEKNPFITEYIWLSNGSRVCPLCMQRDGMHFKKTELPMDHPNGMCTMVPDVSPTMVDDLAKWFNAEDGTYPEIDSFAKNFGYTPSEKVLTREDLQKKYGTSSTSFTPWYKKLSEAQQMEIKSLKEKSGLSWDKWYEKNIYSGVEKVKTVKAKTAKTAKTAKSIVSDKIDVLKGKLSKSLSKEDFDFLVKTLESTDENYQKAFLSSFEKLKNVTFCQNENYFRPADKVINVDFAGGFKQAVRFKMENRFHVFFHETGHAIDSLYTGRSKMSLTKDFMDAMNKDLKAFTNKLKSGDVNELNKIYKLFNDANSRGIQDVMSGAKLMKQYDVINDTIASKISWRHSDAYWKGKTPEYGIASELWAHLSASKVSPIQTEYMKEYFPNALKMFDKFLA